MRILVVEDDAEAATAMVRGLTEAGHEPTHAVDGAFGLLEAQKGGYDVYVVDRMMPRLDGIGMVETLRKDGDQTPVLFVTRRPSIFVTTSPNRRPARCAGASGV